MARSLVTLALLLGLAMLGCGGSSDGSPDGSSPDVTSDAGATGGAGGGAGSHGTGGVGGRRY